MLRSTHRLRISSTAKAATWTVAICQDTRSVWKPDPGAHASSRHALADQLAFAPRTAGGERRDPQLCLYRQDQLSLITGLSLKFHVNHPPGM